jgi:[amino group carrier protein]-L-2-aminoadipate 6-kinase
MTQIAERTEEALVVKLGGGEGLNLDVCCRDLAAIALERPLVVVHGLSAVANRMCAELGIPVRMITSPSGHTSRYTDPQTRDVFILAAEEVNAQTVACLQAYGVNAFGIAPLQTPIQGERKSAVRSIENGRVQIIRDNYTGTITGVNTDDLFALLAAGMTPVLPPVAYHPVVGLLNIDGDRASAAVAAALGARDLVILSNVRGLFRNFPDENSFVSQVAFQQIDAALEWAQGRMKRKVLGAQEALDGGVRRVVIGDGRVANPVQRALDAEGTVFIR